MKLLNCESAAGGEILRPEMEQFWGQKKLPKKLAHRKKSTILRILDSNFKLKLAIQKNSGSRNYRKIRYLEPPQIDLRTRPKLVGTNGMFPILIEHLLN